MCLISYNGCTQCQREYYISNQYCLECNKTIENCQTCSSGTSCSQCYEGYVLKEKKCVPFNQIDQCVQSADSKCVQCSLLYKPSADGSLCEQRTILLVIIIFVIVVIVIICMVCLVIMIGYVISQRKQEEGYTLMKMEETDCDMIDMGNGLIVSTKGFLLNEGQRIKISEEWKETMYIGNNTKHVKMVQITTKKNNQKYLIRTQPKYVLLKKGDVCEFEIFIKPLCTTKVVDKMMILNTNLKTAVTSKTAIDIEFETEISSRIDPDQIIEDRQIGEGAFGIVYLGKFRGNKVAIKKMKEIEKYDQQEEFEKEVAMLDKFRSDYIVYFYGAVFVPRKICMVTEFADYGSVQDLILKRPGKEGLNQKIILKWMLDGAKGIKYLHDNWILHRDIKPENFLVVSLEDGINVNCKLTDFGTSRNINMLKTNMTFTQGVGSPAFMAPEILADEVYTKPCDIYSFAITILETMIWGDAFPDEEFVYAWEIAACISKGKRPSTINKVENQKMKSLIEKMWCQKPKERIVIDEVITHLQDEFYLLSLNSFIEN